MNIKVDHNVTSCGNCPFIRKRSSDDPFTESWVYHYCGKNNDIIIENRNKIDNRCPINKTERGK